MLSKIAHWETASTFVKEKHLLKNPFEMFQFSDLYRLFPQEKKKIFIFLMVCWCQENVFFGERFYLLPWCMYIFTMHYSIYIRNASNVPRKKQFISKQDLVRKTNFSWPISKQIWSKQFGIHQWFFGSDTKWFLCTSTSIIFSISSNWYLLSHFTFRCWNFWKRIQE